MFEIKIHTHENKSDLKHQKDIEYDIDYDDINTLIFDICSVFDDLKIVSFIVKGFKKLTWPVDVRTDLSSIIPQLPNAIKKLKNGQECNIIFFEQGIEREIQIKCENNNAIINCLNLHGIQITKEHEKQNLKELINMLITLIDDFIANSKKVCPRITNHHIFTSWETKIGKRGRTKLSD